MARHQDESGASLHETRVTLLPGSPVDANTVASIAGILAADNSVPDAPQLFLAKSTTPGDWVQIIGGGGGGGGAEWRAGTSFPAPTMDTEFDQKVWKFGKQSVVGDQKLFRTIKVPQSYVTGRPVKLFIEAYSPSNSNTFLLNATLRLIKKNSGVAGSTSLQRTSTNTALTNTVANQSRQVEIDVTTSVGQIGGTGVEAGDVIEVELTRDSSDSDTAEVRLRPDSTEVTFT